MPYRPLLSKSHAALWLLSVLLCGCVSRLEQARRFGSLEPRDYVIVAPAKAREWKSIRRFADWKREAGFTVHSVWTDRASGEPLDQAREVARRLQGLPLAAGHPAYVLVIASDEDITMGPWQLAGTGQEIQSDLPLAFADQLDEMAVRDAHWLPRMAAPRWIFGRIPTTDRATVRAALTSARRFQARATNRTKRALIGAERIALPMDASLALATVRSDLREAGWRATMLSEDLPGDTAIDAYETTASFPRQKLKDVRVHYGYLRRWAQDAPDLVYMVTHSSIDNVANALGIGKYAITPMSFLAYLRGGYREVQCPRVPEHAAMLVTSGCSVGIPNNELVRMLFRLGWIASFCGSTATNGPLPPVAGVAAERDCAYYLARGLPIGIAVAATRDAYLRSAVLDPTSWLLGLWVWPMMRVNAFSYTVYGDPSLQLVRDRHHPHGPLRNP